jgi:arginyl-tRNA synthetase
VLSGAVVEQLSTDSAFRRAALTHDILAELRAFEQALRAGPKPGDLAELAVMVKPVQQIGSVTSGQLCHAAGQGRGENPRLASRIVELQLDDLCPTPEIAGPGFINLTLRDDWIQKATAEIAADDGLGARPVSHPRTYLVDYSAPNIAKPMHVGHLRSTVIGNSLCRVLRHLRHTVIGDNHIGDWGAVQDDHLRI